MDVRAVGLPACVLLLCSVAPHMARIPAPGLVLWAWERPEDLRFIDPSTTGVAYLAATVAIQADGSVRYHFRQQPLALPAGTARIAVVRIESPPSYVFPGAARVAEGLRAVAELPGVQALQIDFDARSSERRFYSDILRELRARTGQPIGITALASWCAGDTWIDSGVVTEAAPMFFRMGRGESKAMSIAPRVCRGATGVSLDEPWPARRNGRLYVFNPHSWTQADYVSVLGRLR